MDYLIKKSDASIIEIFPGGASKIQLPGMTGTDAVHCGGDKRPLDLGDYLLIRATVIEEPVGANQKRGDTIEDVDVVAQTVTVTRPAVDMTAQEIADRDIADDISALRNAGKDMALVLTEFVDWALANTSMTANDFTPNVRQAYQNIKAIADRVK